MPRAVVKNGVLTIVKTEEDVQNEYGKAVEDARNTYLDVTILKEDDPTAIERARNDYKEILLKRDNELAIARQQPQ
jgi:hypothetical protein